MKFDVRDNRNKNWLWMRREILRQHGEELGTRGVTVYAALASYANQHNTAYPSLGSLADLLGISKTTVRKAINDLVDLDWIGYKERTRNNGAKTTHRFYLLECPCPESEPPPSESEPPPSVFEGAPSESEGHEVKRKEVSNSNSARARESEAVKAYREIFPRRPNQIQAEQITHKVDDLDLWKEVLTWWAENGHRAKSVGKMLNKYRQTDSSSDLYRDGPSENGAASPPEKSREII